MKGQIAMFLSRFHKLKNEVSNAPKKLDWLAKEREDIQELCYELQTSYKSIENFLTTKGSKHIFIDGNLEVNFEEYKRNYERFVTKAAEPAEARRGKAIHDAIVQGEETWLESGKTKEEYWEYMEKTMAEFRSPEMDFDPFDPLKDDPDALIGEALDWGSLIKDIVMEDDEPERYEKAWGAWKFVKNRLGLNFSGINKRWIAAPYLFIKPHVAQSEKTPIVELYNEAVRAYIFGCNNASVAMCRALMEHILKTHYKVQGKDLEDRIDNAVQLFPQLKKLKLHRIRKKANEVLHYYESGTNIKDIEVIDCLFTIKILVQEVPKKNIF